MLLSRELSESIADLGEASERGNALKKDEADLAKLLKDIKTLKDGGKVDNLTLPGAMKAKAGLEAAIANKKKLGEDEDLTEGEEFVALFEALNGKVDTFLTVFASILVQYDQLVIKSEMKRGGSGNIYRLSLLLAALDRVRGRVQSVINDDSKEAITKLKAAVDQEFTSGNPGAKLHKVMDAFLQKGSLPKVPISKAVKDQVAAERKAARANGMSMAAEGVDFAFGDLVEADAALAFPGEDKQVKPGGFKISSKALGIFKDQLGPDWKPEQALFQRQRDLIDGLTNDELVELFGVTSMDKAQDVIAGQPKMAFNKWLMRATKVSPKLGKFIRSQPENAALLFYLTMVRVSGRELADIVLKRYFETESDHIGAVKARMKVEDAE